MGNKNYSEQGGLSLFAADFPEDREIHMYLGFHQVTKGPAAGRLLRFGQEFTSGNINHFSISAKNGWVVYPNITVRW
jgi:hypothetical protein